MSISSLRGEETSKGRKFAGQAIYGHQQQVNYLNFLLSSAQLPQVLLFSGPPQVGKATVALHLANSLLNGQQKLGKLSLTQISQLPSFHLCQAASGESLKIDDIRAIQNFLWLKQPDSYGARVVIVDAVSDLQPLAQSVLLKTLEEPKQNSYFILINHLPSQLLATVKSRCHCLQFNFLEQADLHKIVAASCEKPSSFTSPAVATGNLATALLLEQNSDQYHQLLDLVVNTVSGQPSHYRQISNMINFSQKLSKAEVLTTGRLLDLVLLRSTLFFFARPLLDEALVSDEADRLQKISHCLFSSSSYPGLASLIAIRSQLHRALFYSKTIDLEPEQTLVYLFSLLSNRDNLI